MTALALQEMYEYAPVYVPGFWPDTATGTQRRDKDPFSDVAAAVRAGHGREAWTFQGYQYSMGRVIHRCMRRKVPDQIMYPAYRSLK